MSNRDSDELLQISVGGNESLDIIKLEDSSVLVVISERGSIQRRTVVKVESVDAIRMAKFLVGISGEDDNGAG